MFSKHHLACVFVFYFGSYSSESSGTASLGNLQVYEKVKQRSLHIDSEDVTLLSVLENTDELLQEIRAFGWDKMAGKLYLLTLY